MVKHLPAMWETWLPSLGEEDALEKATATHSSILAWRSPRTEEPGGLQSMESHMTQRVTEQQNKLPAIVCFARNPAQWCPSPKRTQTPVPRILCQARKPRQLVCGPPGWPHSPAYTPKPQTPAPAPGWQLPTMRKSAARAPGSLSGGEGGSWHAGNGTPCSRGFNSRTENSWGGDGLTGCSARGWGGQGQFLCRADL